MDDVVREELLDLAGFLIVVGGIVLLLLVLRMLIGT
jgi:hypothetical protein